MPKNTVFLASRNRAFPLSTILEVMSPYRGRGDACIVQVALSIELR